MFTLLTDNPAPDGLLVPDSLQKAQFAEKIDKLVHMDYSQFFSHLAGEAVWVGIKLAGAVVVWIVGR
ncbi:MAG: hypothetical protein K2J33_06605, partial [Alistipes sp.]|nr:hypothetical protein [Alistipes sp.]